MKYRDVKHFGLCLGRRGPTEAARHLDDVTDGVKRTYYEDVKSLEVEQALEFSESSTTRSLFFREFRLALNIQLAPRRYLALRDAAIEMAGLRSKS